MDYRGTWIQNQNDPNKSVKSLNIVDFDDDNCYGPNGIKISINELVNSYSKSDPFVNQQQNNEVAQQFKQFIVSDDNNTHTIKQPIVENIENIHKDVVVHDKNNFDNSIESNLLKTLLSVSSSSTNITFNSVIVLPLHIDVLKSIFQNSKENFNKEKLIKLLIENDKDSILEQLSAAILLNIENSEK